MRKKTVSKKKTKSKAQPSIQLSREGERELVRAISANLIGGMGQEMMSSIMQGDKFVQLAVCESALYALDARGQVWKRDAANNEWKAIEIKRVPMAQLAPSFGFPPPTPAPFRGAP